MRRPIVVAFVGTAIACTLAMPAKAELQFRDGGYYDTVMDITWNHPSLAAYSPFGVPNILPPYGHMSPDTAAAWIAAVNAANYLGTNTWRLPHWADPGDLGCDAGATGECGYFPPTAVGSEYSELAHLWYVTLGNTGPYLPPSIYVGCGLPLPRACLVNVGPFSGFSGLDTLVDYPYLMDGAYDSAGGIPQVSIFNMPYGFQTVVQRNLNVAHSYIWLVADGDVLGGPVEKITFVSNADIYSMTSSGKAQRPITRSLNPVSDLEPAWSPDGTQIAFTSNRAGTSGGRDVYVMNADGSNQTQLTFGGGNTQPTWSPDSTRIAFTTSRNGYPNIYVMNADGSNQTQVTNEADHMPAWSPDGIRIAFVGFLDGGYHNIYTVNPDGSGRIKLTNLVGAYNPAWSPDGTKIAFGKETGSNLDGFIKIFVMNADGSNQIQLSNNSAVEDHPSWSPDGTRIAFQSDRDDSGFVKKSEIYVMNADGSNQVRFTDLPGDTHSVAFQPPEDGDTDGFNNLIDNCLVVANPIQCDSDGDGYGNRCDGDMNNNGSTNAQDTVLFRQQLGQPSVGPTYNKADLNCNGTVNAQDTTLFRQKLGSPPGPSGLVP